MLIFSTSSEAEKINMGGDQSSQISAGGMSAGRFAHQNAAKSIRPSRAVNSGEGNSR